MDGQKVPGMMHGRWAIGGLKPGRTEGARGHHG